jgi:hypothetical protein
MQFYGSNRKNWVFVRSPGDQGFVLAPENVWYCRLKLLLTIVIKSDSSEEVTKIDCAYVFFCYNTKLEESCNALIVCKVC